ncbi:MAG: AIR synthase-related protein [Nannocystaceae bacterium]
MPTYRLEIETRPDLRDALGVASARRLSAYLGLRVQARTRRIYLLDLDVDADEAAAILEVLVDPVAERGALGTLADEVGEGLWHCTVGLRPGVTDSVGRSARRAAEDRLGRRLHGEVYTATTYLLSAASGDAPLPRGAVERAAAEVLHNPLIEQVKIESPPRDLDLTVPRAGASAAPKTRSVALRGADAAELLRISQSGVLALSLEEMEAIQRYWQGRGRDPTDAELECLAQTWSEHCKHKIFASPIDYTDPEGERTRIDRGLFRTYIRGATEAVAADRLAAGVDPEGAPFLVSVFHDNAGVVRFTERDHLVYKVETHNSPSALDPYGGAMTGIVGVNRDTLGTGLGADNLTNVWGYCFGEPDTRGPLPPGLMPPRRIRDGVHHGVIDGGNQSGIPYSRGFELFDRRFLGKPLVYCGTVAVMPTSAAGRPGERKEIAVGDLVVMVGGRIGKDGIHGATFSSGELAEDSPMAAVQIGDPITQKMMADMLAEARTLGLYSGLTDNGAGGLSSSVGEMAQATGGAEIDLARAPLKYPGLAPWEILISEAQERMTVAVRPDRVDEFLALAARREVEATVLGEFTSTGKLVVRHGDEVVCDLDLWFLHEGVPLPTLPARWSPPPRPHGSLDVAAACPEGQLSEVLLELLGRPNLASNEAKARHYDHEVKGLAVVKPFVGARRDVPSTATVMRVRHGRPEGIVLGEGVHPFYSDVDTEAMATAAVDEGVRRVIAAGARVDRLAALDNFCWPDPVESAKTPDGAHKLAQLVRACQGLRAACEAFGVPLISGKDSMKNDATLGGVKISIPPTLLVSVLGQMEDVSRAIDLTPLAAGDLVAVLGPTRDELGESELARARGWVLGSVPRTDLGASAARLRAFAGACDRGLVRSAHVVGRGGLAVALAHMTMAGELGLDLSLDAIAGDLASVAALFSESTGRLVLTAPPGARAELTALLGDHGLAFVGVTAPPRAGGGWLRISRGAGVVIDIGADALRRRFQGGLDDAG